MALGQSPDAFNLQGFIDAAVKSGSRRIVIPPGRYRVTPQRREHLGLRNLNDIEIVAQGVELVCTQTTRAVTIAGCNNLTLRGLTIDYDPLPFTQGVITNISPDGRAITVELFEGYPPAAAATNVKFEVFARETRTLREGELRVGPPQVLDARHLRFIKQLPLPDGIERIGDLVVTIAAHAPDGSIPHAVFAEDCAGLTLEAVTLFASPTFGFLEHGCERSTYRRCRVDRRPLESDLKPRGAARLRSLNADAFHSAEAPLGPSIVDCTAQFMGDDAVNIHGHYHLVIGSRGKLLRVLAQRWRSAHGSAG